MKFVYPDGDDYVWSLIQNERLKLPNDFEYYDNPPLDENVFFERIKDAKGVILGWTKLTKKIMRRCEKLRFACFLGVGASTYIDIQEATRMGIAVTNTPHYGDNTVAEHALMLLLAACRHVVPLDRKIREGEWDLSREGLELRGKTIGIVGLGGIGAAMARIANALGMKVVCWTRNPSKERAAKHLVEFVDWDELFSRSGFVSLHLPYAEGTQKIIGGSEFSKMQPGSIFINTARAELVDTDALVKALREGPLMAAGMDVFETEPFKPPHPLLEMDNVVVTPHVAYNTREATINILRIGLNNAITFEKGNPMNVLNPEVLSAADS